MGKKNPPKEKKRKYTIDDLRKKGMILLEYVSGSQMYGTNTPTSDVDHRGIFIMPDEDFSDFNYSPDWEEVESGKMIVDGKDTEMTFYELRKFLQLLEKNSPNSLEIFNIPDNCLIYKHPLMDAILLNWRKILTKKCYQSFSGYAMDQTSKAHGKNKKQNWEKERFERKSILDFCYVPWKQGSIPIKEWMKKVLDFGVTSTQGTILKSKGASISQEMLGLVKIPHMPFTYGVYVGGPQEGCRGLIKEMEDTDASALRVSDIPKNAIPATTMTFNESAWSIHCDEYRSYLDWQANKNEARWVDVKGHNQKIDGKNMLHMQRLINMATDIALNKGIVTRRPEAADLLKIRRGEVSLQALLDSCKIKLEELKTLFDNNHNLPEEVEPGFCEQMNKNIRKYFNAAKDNERKTAETKS